MPTVTPPCGADSPKRRWRIGTTPAPISTAPHRCSRLMSRISRPGCVWPAPKPRWTRPSGSGRRRTRRLPKHLEGALAVQARLDRARLYAAEHQNDKAAAAFDDVEQSGNEISPPRRSIASPPGRQRHAEAASPQSMRSSGCAFAGAATFSRSEPCASNPGQDDSRYEARTAQNIKHLPAQNAHEPLAAHRSFLLGFAIACSVLSSEEIPTGGIRGFCLT